MVKFLLTLILIPIFHSGISEEIGKVEEIKPIEIDIANFCHLDKDRYSINYACENIDLEPKVGVSKYKITTSQEAADGTVFSQNSKIPTLSKEISEIFQNVLDFTLRNCSVANITEDFMKGFNRICKLSIFENRQSFSCYDCFKYANTLKTLDLSSNHLNRLVDNFTLPSENVLTSLDLDKNSIESFPKSLLNNLYELQEISLSENEISEIPENAFVNNKKLKFINLAHNKITSMSPNVFENLSLKELYLDGNRLKMITLQNSYIISIMNNEHLKSVFVRNNVLRINAENCQIENVFVDSVNTLEILFLGNNSLNSLEGITQKAKHLQYLIVSRNKQLGNGDLIFDFRNLKELEYLDMSDCNLKDEHFNCNTFKNSKNLEKIYLANNNISNYSVFSKLKPSAVVYIDGNIILEIDNSRKCKP